MTNYPAVAIMVVMAITSGSLGAIWDSGAVHDKSLKFATAYISLVALVITEVYWLALSHDIGQFWWYQLSGNHHLPKLDTINTIPLSDIDLRLLPAIILTMASVPGPVLLSYWLAGRRIAKRQRRMAAKEVSSSE